jgi:hypothetical protein
MLDFKKMTLLRRKMTATWDCAVVSFQVFIAVVGGRITQ